MIDYEVLRFIWWLLVGILLIGFAVTDFGRPDLLDAVDLRPVYPVPGG